MKLLNKSFVYLSISLFFIIGIWSIIFYFNMLNEIKESIDEGLDNYKRQIIYTIQKDSNLLKKTNFRDSFYSIKRIPRGNALKIKDSYKDTLMHMQDADDEAPELEPVRMLTTAFENDTIYYKLRIINSMVEEDDLIKGLLREAIGLYIILILAIILINNIVLQKLWKPFYQLLNQLKKYQIGINNQLPEIDTKTKEFVDLQKAVNILMQHTIEIFEQQKQFIGNASHELQTPLAIATNKLELLIENGELQEHQVKNLAEIMNIINRLVRLNKSLLLLTKIENKQFNDSQSICWNDVVNRCILELEDLILFKEINLSVIEKSVIYADVNPYLAHSVVSNLLRNAIFHNINGGKIEVLLDENLLKINNTGLKTSINKEKIFTRFHKSEFESNGSGLGLSIVKTICDLYQIKVTYLYENELHCFELFLT